MASHSSGDKNRRHELTETLLAGLLLCSLRDAGCFCAYDAINDTDMTIFELLNQYVPDRAEKVRDAGGIDVF